MSVKHASLGILSERERHGYELKAAFDERVGEFWSLNYGQIYTTLDRLEREGLVEWLGRPITRTRALRDELFIKLLFVGRGGVESVLDLIQRQKETCLGRMKRLTQRKFELSKLERRDDLLVTELLVDAALFHAEADVRWLGHAEQKLGATGRRRARSEAS
jgi:DNA-binding PadR family transcriptional regulator